MPRPAVIALWAAIAALVVAQAVVSVRLARLQDQIAKMGEEKSGPGGAVASAGGRGASTEEGGPAANPAASPGGSRESDGAGASPDATGTSDPLARPSEKLASSSGGMTAKEIEDLVERKMKERDKKNPLVSLLEFEDPMEVMERELKLSPIQKTRIEGHMKTRDDAYQELWKGLTPDDWKNEWKEINEKQEEVRKSYEENVKRELDLAQQEKYDDLKKKGKLVDFGGGGGGMSVFVNKTVEGEEEEKPAGR